jgi:glycosyltransferase involved in cell wall biosynthesis/SAM-dependent methyltransferase
MPMISTRACLPYTDWMRGRIVLATYNEADSIRPVLAEVQEAVAILERSGVALDVLLVDDSSPDHTAEIAVTEAKKLGLNLEVLSGKKEGLGKAILRGFAYALTTNPPDFFVTLDADGQHDARQIPDLVRAFLARDSGITIGSRWARGGASPGTPPGRAILSKLGNLLVRQITGLRGVRDATTSFRVIKPEVAKLFKPEELKVDGYGFFSAFVALTQAHGYTIDEVPIIFRPRYSGISKLTRKELLDFFTNLFKVRKQVHMVRSATHDDQTAWATHSSLFNRQHAEDGKAFGGEKELANLANAHQFFDWIVSEFQNDLGADILEVGAGIGTVALKLAQHAPSAQITATEPALNLFEQLCERVKANPSIKPKSMTSQQLTFAEPETTYDTVVYVNVMEHIEDDASELRTAHALLRAGGNLCIFVPAMPALYGTLDYKSGHYRRYNRQSLARVVNANGFTITRNDYFDVAGLVPYWLMYRFLGVQTLGSGTNTLFNRVIVPASRATQRIIKHPPIGKNLILTARKNSQSAK